MGNTLFFEAIIFANGPRSVKSYLECGIPLGMCNQTFSHRYVTVAQPIHPMAPSSEQKASRIEDYPIVLTRVMRGTQKDFFLGRKHGSLRA
jgi:hypothetical protein